jgi:hypothetical protein
MEDNKGEERKEGGKREGKERDERRKKREGENRKKKERKKRRGDMRMRYEVESKCEKRGIERIRGGRRGSEDIRSME